MAFGLTLVAGHAQAGVYSFTTAPNSYDRQLSLGFTFTTNTAVEATALGYYDDQGEPFLTSHEVGIYTGDGLYGAGTLFVSTTLAAGTSGTLGADDFRYQSITPLLLPADQTYTIAGLSPCSGGCNDPWVYGGPTELTGFTVEPIISIGPDAALFTYDPGGLTDPASHYSDYQIYAVNFLASGVPESPIWAMMLSGFALVGLRLRRRMRGAETFIEVPNEKRKIGLSLCAGMTNCQPVRA